MSSFVPVQKKVRDAASAVGGAEFVGHLFWTDPRVGDVEEENWPLAQAVQRLNLGSRRRRKGPKPLKVLLTNDV